MARKSSEVASPKSRTSKRQTRSSNATNGHTTSAEKLLNGLDGGSTLSSDDKLPNLKTDLTRWRLRDVEGVQTWHYLESDKAVKAWPQTIADKYFLGLPTVWPI